MSWESYEDFKNAAKVHFGFSLLLMIFFGVGYHHSRNTDFSAEGTAPYWVFGAVGGALHFFCVLLSSNVFRKRSSDHELHGALACYHFWASILIIWSFAATIATGVIGVCSDMESCVYQEHQDVNKAMAICIVVFHALSFFYCIHTSGESGRIKNNPGSVSPTTPPKTVSVTIEHPYQTEVSMSRNPQPPPYTTPLQSTYAIASPPSDVMPPPPSYESILAGAHPTAGHEPAPPSVVHPPRPRANSQKISRKSHNHRPQPTNDTKRKSKPTVTNSTPSLGRLRSQECAAKTQIKLL